MVFWRKTIHVNFIVVNVPVIANLEHVQMLMSLVSVFGVSWLWPLPCAWNFCGLATMVSSYSQRVLHSECSVNWAKFQNEGCNFWFWLLVYF